MIKHGVVWALVEPTAGQMENIASMAKELLIQVLIVSLRAILSEEQQALKSDGNITCFENKKVASVPPFYTKVIFLV